MRARLIVGAIGVIGFGFWYHVRNIQPTASQVEPLVREFLEQEACGGGSRVVDQLDDVSVGPYVSQFGGWPVYADHVEECDGSNTTARYDGSHDADNKVAVAFARRTATGRVEIFMPELFAQAQQQMNATFQKAFDGK